MAKNGSQILDHGGFFDRPSDISIQEKFPYDQPLDKAPDQELPAWEGAPPEAFVNPPCFLHFSWRIQCGVNGLRRALAGAGTDDDCVILFIHLVGK